MLDSGKVNLLDNGKIVLIFKINFKGGYMRVERKNDRLLDPEECDNCGYKTSLERFYFYGPGHNVEWLCEYCRLDHSHGENDVIRTVAGMLNRLEERLKKEIISTW